MEIFNNIKPQEISEELSEMNYLHFRELEPGDHLPLCSDDRSHLQGVLDIVNKQTGKELTILPDGEGFIVKEIAKLEGEDRKIFIALEKERGKSFSEIAKKLGINTQQAVGINKTGKKRKRNTKLKTNGEVLPPLLLCFDARSHLQGVLDIVNKQIGSEFTLLPDGEGFIVKRITKLQGEDRKMFIALEKKRGKSYSEIAKKLGMSIHRTIGIDIRNKRKSNRSKLKIDYAMLAPEFVKLYNGGNGLTIHAICNKLGVSFCAVKRWLMMSGVEIQSKWSKWNNIGKIEDKFWQIDIYDLAESKIGGVIYVRREQEVNFFNEAKKIGYGFVFLNNGGIIIENEEGDFGGWKRVI